MARLREYYQVRPDVLGKDTSGNVVAYSAGELITGRVMKKYNIPVYMCKKVMVNPEEVIVTYGVMRLRVSKRGSSNVN